MRVSSEVEKPRVFGGGGEEWGLVGSAKEEVTGRVGQVGLDQEVPPRSQLCPNLPAQWSEMGELSLSVKAWACFFSPQPAVLSLLSHPYMTTGKTIALTRWTFIGKVMSLLLNILSRLVITFLPRSKRLLISWLPSPSAVILEPLQNKV